MPHTLRAIDGQDETIAELEMIVGFDDDLAGEATQVANRLHGLLTQIHPSAERVLGPRLQHPAVLTLLERFGSPAQIRKAGRRRLVTLLRPKAPRMAERLVEEFFDALDEQTVTVPGTEAATLIVPSLARSLTAILDQRKLLAARIEELLDAHPLSKVLTSMPGIGVRTGARILIEVGDGSTFPTAGHLAAYAGLAPATRSSGSSIRGEQPSRRKQAAQMGLLPLRVRRLGRPGIAGLLRQEDRPGQAPHPSPAQPRQTAGRRAVRDAPRRHLLRTSACSGGRSADLDHRQEVIRRPVIDLPVGIDPHGAVLLAPKPNGHPSDRPVAGERERDCRLELLAPARTARLARMRVLPELLAIRDERAAAATNARPFGPALNIVNENAEHAPATPATDRRNDLHRTAVGGVPEKHRDLRRDTLVNLIISMHGHIVPDARTSTHPP